MAKSVQGKGANLFVYILIGLLILGLAGFGIGSFTSSVSAIGTVGDEEITVEDYYQQLQVEIDSFARLNGQRITALQAVQAGLGQNALETLVLQAAIDNEARRIGVSVGDQTIVNELSTMPQFAGADGNFNRDAYKFALQRTGTTATEFDQIIKSSQTRSLIESTLSRGIPPANPYINRLMNYYLSTRDVTWASVTEDLLEETAPTPSDQELRNYHRDNEVQFTIPEMRKITVAWITPDELADSETVTEERAQTLYEERANEYSKPERRDVDRLVFPNLKSAQIARERLDSEELDFDALATELGIVISDISLGAIEREELTEAAAKALFSDDASEIVGPVESKLGPALFRVNAVLGEQFTPFDAAQESLSKELARKDAIALIDNSISNIEDLLASGATIEELATETVLTLEEIAFDENKFDGIASFEEFRIAANTIQVGDFPELLELGDDGLFTVRLNEIVPPKVRPYEEVETEVLAAWEFQNLAERLQAKALELVDKLKTGAKFEELNLVVQNKTELTRNQFFDDAPSGFASKVFNTDILEFAIIGNQTEWAVFRVDSESLPDANEENNDQILESLTNQFTSGISQDVLDLFGNHIRQKSGLNLNLEVIDAIHAQLN